MKTKEEIFKKAKAIVKKNEDDLIHKTTCLKAKICPECGNELFEFNDRIGYGLECSDHNKYYTLQYDDENEEA